MYFIDDTNDLEGKVIGFVSANQFADYTTISTKDGGVCLIQQKTDEFGDTEIRVYPKIQAQYSLYNDKYVRDELNKRGIITEKDWEEYDKEVKRKQEQVRKDHLRRKEEADRKRYEELKKKFGSESN
ncbi:hypothetical protein Goe21_01510 [Bacillus phage vB_BsuM-Goe21]|nr:hypothetical protein Goe21_01510 [Bacillus phage vB_BsuM-Goe21]